MKRSNRRTLSVEVDLEGNVIVRAPRFVAKRQIDEFLLQKEDWINAAMKRASKRIEAIDDFGYISDEELERYRKTARKVLVPLVEYYAREMGVTYNRISIRAQKTRWGSCSREGNLNFNCLLMLCPEEITHYVVVHELAHRREMNHSARFWSIVGTYRPDYRSERLWLKKNGGTLIARLP